MTIILSSTHVTTMPATYAATCTTPTFFQKTLLFRSICVCFLLWQTLLNSLLPQPARSTSVPHPHPHSLQPLIPLPTYVPALARALTPRVAALGVASVPFESGFSCLYCRFFPPNQFHYCPKRFNSFTLAGAGIPSSSLGTTICLLFLRSGAFHRERERFRRESSPKQRTPILRIWNLSGYLIRS